MILLKIALKEFRETVRDGRFRMFAWLILALFAVSTAVSWNYYRQLRKQHDSAREVARQQWENQGAKNPHGAAHYGTFAFKPIYALSLLDNGLDKFLGVSLFLEAHRQNFDQYKAVEDQNSLARFGELTPAFVLVYLVPLLIVLIGFSRISAEHESGMWRMMLSQGTSARQLVWGKIMGMWGLLFAFLAPVFLLSFAFLAFAEGTLPDDFARFGLICAVLLLYYGVFIHVSLGMSAWVRRSNVALVALLGFWIASTLLVPRLSVNLAEYLHPVPSYAAYQKALREDLEKGVDGHDPYNEYSQKLEAEMLAKHGVDSVQKLPFNWWGFVMQKGEEHEKVVYDKHVNALQDLYRKQLAVHEAGSLLSPTTLVRNLSMTFARTDLEAHHDFKAKAEQYRIQLVGDLNKDLEVNSSYNDWDYESDEAFFAQTARFDYHAPALSDTWLTALRPMWLLVAWFALSLLVVSAFPPRSY